MGDMISDHEPGHGKWVDAPAERLLSARAVQSPPSSPRENRP